MDRRAGERVPALEAQRDAGGPLQRGEVEAVGELARGGLQVLARELGLVEPDLDAGHREEGRASTVVVREHLGQEAPGEEQGLAVAPGDGVGDARLDGLLQRVEGVEGGLALVDVGEVGERVLRGPRHRREALETRRGLDDVIGAEHGRHRPVVVDGDVRHVQVARGRREHHRHHPRVAGDTADPPDLAHVEQPPEPLAEHLGDELPRLLASHAGSIPEPEPWPEPEPDFPEIGLGLGLGRDAYPAAEGAGPRGMEARDSMRMGVRSLHGGGRGRKRRETASTRAWPAGC